MPTILATVRKNCYVIISGRENSSRSQLPFSRVNLARRRYALLRPRDVVSRSSARRKIKKKHVLATPRYGRYAAVDRDLCIYSGKDSGTDDGRDRDVISWQGPKSREESMVSSVSTRVVPRCRCNNPRRSCRHTYTPT